MNPKLFPILSALGRLTPGLMLFLLAREAQANPTGMTVQSGSATLSINGSQLTVNPGNNTFLNWQSFNIAHDEHVVFNQPSAASVVWNRVNDPHPSQIYGSIQANGVVVLLNSSGFYFGPNSFVSAAGLVVSTANCAPPQNSGGAWEFNGPPPLASIVNYGQIKIGNGGDCFLIADKIENHGSLEAPGGNIALAAGQTVTLSERPDGRGMTMNVLLPQGSVDNHGNIIADGGTIALHAKVVNQDGFIQANSVSEKNGVIELVAADELNLGAESKIFANGDASVGGSAGGQITLKSSYHFQDAIGSQIEVTGGSAGGNGGAVEVSAPAMSALNSKMDGSAQAGFRGGKLLIDPDYIVLDQGGGEVPDANGNVAVGDRAGETLYFNVNNGGSFAGFSDITLQAAYDITLADNTTWNLSASTGSDNNVSHLLTLAAGRNIIFGNSTGLTDKNKWSVAMFAGVTDFSSNKVGLNGDGQFQGSIFLNAFDPNQPDNVPTDPTGYIRLASGSVTMVAGQDVTVGLGRVNTTAGGNIDVHALAGSIDTGGNAQGYLYRSASSSVGGYSISTGLGIGGISTTAGGDVNLTAGKDVSSILPGKDGYYYNGNFISSESNPNITTAGAGAYGFGANQIGNVNIIAGGNVTGHFLVANGTGNIFAGVKMDAAGNPLMTGGKYQLGNTGDAGSVNYNLALSLITGGWNVTAGRDIFLQEVRNPNGVFNTRNSGAYHYFDYADTDFVKLTAGYQVQLGGSDSLLPRLSGVDNLKVPVIYPGILEVNAGAGGVNLIGDSTYNELILFPSKYGSLIINTTDGGALNGNLPNLNGTPQIFSLIISDSEKKQYNSSSDDIFGITDHAGTPVHYDNPTPIELNISGDMSAILLATPEAAQINVVGNMYNSRFQGMNLHDHDISSIVLGAEAKLNLEHKGILNAATDGGLTVGGDIINRSVFTSIDLSQIVGASAPDFSLVPQAVLAAGDPTVATLLSSFNYNSVTKVLTYKNISGRSLDSVLALLQNLQVQKYVNGIPQWQNPPLNTIPVLLPAPVAVLNAATATALQNRYNELGPIPDDSGGYLIGGGGKFEIRGRNVDLGTTFGVQAAGVGYYRSGNDYPLAQYFTKGANIDIQLTGNLDMFSSSIATFNGSDIFIKAGGDLKVGSSEFSETTKGARGIFSTGQGDVTVIANGDVNVNGSRIAAYDGGNVTVKSLHGDVNAGNGGNGSVVIGSYTVDPVTRAVNASTTEIFGSGILATTFPNSAGQTVGNILVEALNGDVKANKGGIVQLSFNDVESPDATVGVFAGYELRDTLGNPVTAANISAGAPVLVSANRNLDATGSGVIAQNAILKASGKLDGVIVARGNIDLSAVGNVNVTALAQGNVNVSSGGTISGTIVGVSGVSASGSSIDASLLSQNVSASGDTSGAQQGFAQGNAAGAASQGASNEGAAKDAKKSTASEDEDPKKKKGIALAQKVSRVTVLLPAKKATSEVNTHTPKI